MKKRMIQAAAFVTTALLLAATPASAQWAPIGWGCGCPPLGLCRPPLGLGPGYPGLVFPCPPPAVVPRWAPYPGGFCRAPVVVIIINEGSPHHPRHKRAERRDAAFSNGPARVSTGSAAGQTGTAGAGEYSDYRARRYARPRDRNGNEVNPAELPLIIH